MNQQMRFAFGPELIVDLFAGGGGASLGVEQAFGRDVDVAINHDRTAIAVHTVNHPRTRHYCEDVFDVDPIEATGGKPVGLMHASPDCTHHSQARGGQPRSRKIRALAWVVLKWAGRARPRVITLENVWQMVQWSPLVAKRDRATGRVVKVDGTVAARGEVVPIAQQFLVPCPRRNGRTWNHFVAALRARGYAVQWKKLKACDYGAPTSRERLFLVARRDGLPIRWPKPTHGKGKGLLPYRTAAECIDWSIPCPSIFDRKKPLADATHRRIARGVQRFVLDAAEPFIVTTAHTKSSGRGPGAWSVDEPLRTATASGGFNVVAPVLAPILTEHANATSARSWSADEPLRTQCAQVKGGHFAVATPFLAPLTHQGGDRAHAPDAPISTITAAHRGEIAAIVPVVMGVGGRAGQTDPRGGDEPHYTTTRKADAAIVAASVVKFRHDSAGAAVGEPLPTITAGGDMQRPAGAAHALGVMAAYLEQANTGMVGHDARKPASTIVGKGCTQRLIAAHLQHASTSNTNGGRGKPDAPLRTILAGGTHNALVECTLSPEAEEGALRVAAFLMRYHGTGGQWSDLRDPATAVTTKDRLALVTVMIRGEPYVIVDIGLRMLSPDELKRCQGFPDTYRLDVTPDGKPVTKTAQVKLIGNSVSPPPLRALVAETCGELIAFEREADAA